MPRGQWGASQLQAVLFLKKALPATDIFSALVGVPPDSQEDRPKEAVRVQSGQVENGRLLQVIVNPIRVDIFVSAVLGVEALVAASPILGDFGAEVDKFAAMITKWLPQCDFPVLRLALVAKALAPADSTIGAYEILKSNLKSVQVRPGEMRDFMFRVNWQVPTTSVPEGYLNRLTTWASFALNVRAGSPGGPMLAAAESHYAQRDIDVNTPAEHAEELRQASLAPIFTELHQVVIDTAEAGEGP